MHCEQATRRVAMPRGASSCVWIFSSERSKSVKWKLLSVMALKNACDTRNLRTWSARAWLTPRHLIAFFRIFITAWVRRVRRAGKPAPA